MASMAVGRGGGGGGGWDSLEASAQKITEAFERDEVNCVCRGEALASERYIERDWVGRITSNAQRMKRGRACMLGQKKTRRVIE